MAYLVGIDIGGTFTDAVLLDERGVARLFKTPTTPTEPGSGVTLRWPSPRASLAFLRVRSCLK